MMTKTTNNTTGKVGSDNVTLTEIGLSLMETSTTVLANGVRRCLL
jgi:hypothetical protein